MGSLPPTLKMFKTSQKVFIVLSCYLQAVLSQLALGAGTGTGSCRAFPYRAAQVDWDVCPSDLPCCNEYGYCRSREEWTQQRFRDCNGVSNGIDLPDSVLDLENTLGGDPGPGLGADSDFDKRQLEKVGSGSPAQGLNPFALAPVPVPDDFDFDGDNSNSGSSSASGGFRSRGSNGRDDPSNGIGSSASSRGSSSRRGSNRERTPVGSSRGSSSSSGSSSSTGSNGGRAPSGSNSGSSRRTNGNQGFPFSGVGNQRRQQAGGRGQQGRRTGGQSPVAQNTATRIPPSRNPPRAFPPRINTPKSPSTKFVSSAGGNQNLLAEVFGESTETERPRLPAKPSQFVPRPSVGRRRPRPGPSNNVRGRPVIGQQQSTTRKFSGGSTRKSLSGQGSSRTRGSTNRSKASSSGTKDIKPTDLYPLAGYKNTAGYPMNLNAEYCPNYPFCYWNPYGAGSKD